MSPRVDPTRVQPGDPLPEVAETIERMDLVRYAGASGDFNPIHWNDEVARAVGLPGVIAHGMYSMGVAARMVTAWAGDRLLATGKVAAAQPKGRHELLTLETEITTEDGEPVCTVRATLLSRGTAPPRERRA